jgi:hypothetical protein
MHDEPTVAYDEISHLQSKEGVDIYCNKMESGSNKIKIS